jgi:hypothetical protein
MRRMEGFSEMSVKHLLPFAFSFLLYIRKIVVRKR